jgi:hypothetical protein
MTHRCSTAFYDGLFAPDRSFRTFTSFGKQFTILNFVRVKSWPIAQYSFISALSPTKREGAFAALLSPHCLLKRPPAGVRDVYHLRLRALALRVEELRTLVGGLPERLKSTPSGEKVSGSHAGAPTSAIGADG